MWNTLRRIVGSSEPVVTVEDAKRHLAIWHNDDDDLIGQLIEVATAYIDGPNGIGVALQPQTWRATLDALPRKLSLPLRPVRQIVAVTNRGETVTFDHDEDTGVLSFDSYPRETVKVDFVCGYEEVPADLLHAVRMIVGHLYSNREAYTTQTLNEVPMAVETILNRYRAYGW